MMRKFRSLFRNNEGSAAIEYVALLLPLIALVFTSLQIALAYHFALTAQKAVELGARIAAVRDAVHTGLPSTNELDTGSGFGAGSACAFGACTNPGGPWVCSGETVATDANCDVASFNEIRDEVARLAYLLDDDDLSITYSYGLLGYADGPFVPIVEVAIVERPFFLQFFFNLAFGGEGDDIEVTLPSVAATAIAEDLSSTN